MPGNVLNSFSQGSRLGCLCTQQSQSETALAARALCRHYSAVSAGKQRKCTDILDDAGYAGTG